MIRAARVWLADLWAGMRLLPVVVRQVAVEKAARIRAEVAVDHARTVEEIRAAGFGLNDAEAIYLNTREYEANRLRLQVAAALEQIGEAR